MDSTNLSALEDAAPALAQSWRIGWSLILAGFLSGALIGLRFQRPEFLGGYGSLRRRLVRLGHIALIALGLLNLVYCVGSQLGHVARWPELGAHALALGGVAMPTLCFLSAWRPVFRHLFFIPVAALSVAAVSAILAVPA